MAGALLWAVARNWDYVVDDVFINLRYARHLLEGEGLVFNPGERVEGYTNITIVLLLKIVISDYIVHIAPLDFRLEAVPGMAEREGWYRTNWIAVEFALLYRGYDPYLKRTVAVKLCTAEDTSIRRQFLTEAEIAAGLDDSQRIAQRASVRLSAMCRARPWRSPAKRRGWRRGDANPMRPGRQSCRFPGNPAGGRPRRGVRSTCPGRAA